MYERFKELCNRNGLQMNQACKELKISPGAVTNWKTRGSLPSGELCIRIADYFNVSTDEVLGRKTGHEKVTKTFPLSKGYDITPFEYEIIMAYRAADEYDKTSIVRTLKLEEKKERGTGTA